MALTGFVVSLAAWDYVNALLARSPILGGIATGLIALLIGVLLIISLRELAAFGRLRKIDRIQHSAIDAHASGKLDAARAVISQLEQLYGSRDDTAWGRAELKSRQSEILDAEGLLGLAENTLLAPLDARAQREVEAAALEPRATSYKYPGWRRHHHLGCRGLCLFHDGDLGNRKLWRYRTTPTGETSGRLLSSASWTGHSRSELQM